MAEYEISRTDAEEAMIVEAETPSKAKYKNYLEWSGVFGVNDFRGYLEGLIYCKKPNSLRKSYKKVVDKQAEV